MSMAGPRMDEDAIDIRDDANKWIELAASVPVTTLEAMQAGFGIGTIGSMQASLRSENDLDDFMFAMLFQPGGSLLHQTGMEGWERGLRQDRFRISRWGATMARLCEDCHHAVRMSRQNAGSKSGRNLNPATFG